MHFGNRDLIKLSDAEKVWLPDDLIAQAALDHKRTATKMQKDVLRPLNILVMTVVPFPTTSDASMVCFFLNNVRSILIVARHVAVLHRISSITRSRSFLSHLAQSCFPHIQQNQRLVTGLAVGIGMFTGGGIMFCLWTIAPKLHFRQRLTMLREKKREENDNENTCVD